MRPCSQLSLEPLIDTLAILPPHWRIVPVNHHKQPLGKAWQHRPFSPKQMISALVQHGRVSVLGKNQTPYAVTPAGIGVLCGETEEGYLIAIDVDGKSAYGKIDQLSRGQGLPPTVAFTSGRPHRAQYLFTIPQTIEGLHSRKLWTGEGEALELRGSGHQSVLPPSPHPLTGSYRWLQRPDQIAVAPAPDWTLDLLRSSPRKKRSQLPQPQWRFPPTPCGTTIPQAKLLLEVIHPRYADDYRSWIFVGMALKYVSPDLLPDWDDWSQQSSKYQPGECPGKWGSFRGVGITDRLLHYYAQNS